MTLIFHSLQLNYGLCVRFLKIGLEYALMPIRDYYNILKLEDPSAHLYPCTRPRHTI